MNGNVTRRHVGVVPPLCVESRGRVYLCDKREAVFVEALPEHHGVQVERQRDRLDGVETFVSNSREQRVPPVDVRRVVNTPQRLREF